MVWKNTFSSLRLYDLFWFLETQATESHLPLKQASSSSTSTSAMLAGGPFRLLSNSLTGRGSVLRMVPGGTQGTKTMTKHREHKMDFHDKWDLHSPVLKEKTKTFHTQPRTVPVAIIVTSFWWARLMNLLVQASVQVFPSRGITSDKQQWIA